MQVKNDFIVLKQIRPISKRWCIECSNLSFVFRLYRVRSLKFKCFYKSSISAISLEPMDSALCYGIFNSTFNASINQTFEDNSDMISDGLLTFWFFMTILLCVIGSILFTLLLAILHIQKQASTGSGVLLVHLFLLEFVICAILTPISITSAYSLNGRKFGHHGCAVIALLNLTTLHAANWATSFLAMNRFMATVLPHRYKGWIRSGVNPRMIVACWAAGFGCNLPIYFGIVGRFEQQYPSGLCAVRPDVSTSKSFAVVTAFGIYVPICLVFFIYLSTLCSTAPRMVNNWTRVGPLQPQVSNVSDTGQRKNPVHRRLVITQMLFASALWYCLCYLPPPILLTADPVGYMRNAYLQVWMRTLQLCGHAVNPLIFFAVNQDYRDGLRIILKKIF